MFAVLNGAVECGIDTFVDNRSAAACFHELEQQLSQFVSPNSGITIRGPTTTKLDQHHSFSTLTITATYMHLSHRCWRTQG